MRSCFMVLSILFLSGGTPFEQSKVPYVILDQENFFLDTMIVADTIEIASGAKIRVHSGMVLNLVADKIIVSGPAFIDGRGDDGGTGAKCMDSHTRMEVESDDTDDHGIIHRAWEDSGDESNVGCDGDTGHDGGPGAIVIFTYYKFEGAERLKTNYRGGIGGPGGRGGAGDIICCSICGQCKRGPSGKLGLPGKSGPDGREIHNKYIHRKT